MGCRGHSFLVQCECLWKEDRGEGKASSFPGSAGRRKEGTQLSLAISRRREPCKELFSLALGLETMIP